MEHRKSKCKEAQQHVLFFSLLSPIFASSRASLPSFAVLSNSFVNKGQWTHKLLILLNHTLPVLLKKKRQHLEITNRGRNPKTIEKEKCESTYNTSTPPQSNGTLQQSTKGACGFRKTHLLYRPLSCQHRISVCIVVLPPTAIRFLIFFVSERRQISPLPPPPVPAYAATCPLPTHKCV